MSDSPYKFDAPDADVIVRAPLKQGSEELEDFRVHKAILSIASTFFRDMFSIPQPPQPTKSDDTLPIVQVTESAEDFEAFLRLIYPIEPPVLSLQSVDHLFRVAEKYMASGVHAKLRHILVSPSFLEKDPVVVYIIAHRTNLDREARLAIPHTFNTDLVMDISRDQLRIMTAEAYHRLLVEHSLRRDKLVEAVDEVYRSWEKSSAGCHCAEQLKKQMRLQISKKPFLNREMLEDCLSSAMAPFGQCGDWACLLTTKGSPRFFSDFMGRIHEI